MPTWTDIRQARPREFVQLLARALASASGAPLATPAQAASPATESHAATPALSSQLASTMTSAVLARIPWKK